MAANQMTNISTLQTEILANIFAYVRTDADMAAVTAVSRKWRDVMAKDMWEDTTTSLKSSAAKDLEALMHSESGLLQHIRYLYMKEMDEDEAADERLTRLLAAVPENKLRHFGSTTDLSVAALRTLLQRQKRIKSMDVLDLVELIQQDKEDLVLSALSGVTKYYMSAPKRGTKNEEEKKEHYKICRQLINKLTNIKVFGVSNDNISHDADEQNGDLELCRLTEFTIDGVNLAPSSKFVLEHINLDVLQEIYLNNSIGVTEFLNGLSQIYARQSGPLTCLAIKLPYSLADPNELDDAVERFLNTCPKLTWLVLDLIHYFITTTACIKRHADTLTYLYYNVGDWPNEPGYWDIRSFKAIVDGCPKLKGLTCNTHSLFLDDLPNVADDWYLGSGRFDIAYVPSELEAQLDVIAAHPSLTSLRLLDPPSFDWNTADGEPCQDSATMAKHCRILMQNFADQMLRYLSARGSKIKLLMTKPCTMPPRRPAKDRNSHQWPVYAYTKGCVTDARGVRNVVAVPLDKVKMEMWEHESMNWN